MNPELEQFSRRITTLEGNAVSPTHRHDGYDAVRVKQVHIDQYKIWVNHTIAGTAAATATNYGVIFIAPFPCYVTRFQEVHQTAGTDGGSVTLMLEKLTGTTAPDSGSSVLDAALSLKATANTVQSGVIRETTNLANTNLATGDRLCLKDSGALTSVANVTVMVEIQIKQ